MKQLVYLLLRYCIKNQSIGVPDLFWIFEYITTGPFTGLSSADCPDVKNVPEFLQQWVI